MDLTKQSAKDVLELLVASDELILEELLNNVQNYLIKEQAAWIQQNFVLVLHTVFKLSNCKKLEDHCLESICAEPQPFITSNRLIKISFMVYLNETIYRSKKLLFGII